MASDPKTVPTDIDPRHLLEAVSDERRRSDALRLLDIVGEVTGAKPEVWGDSIIGFGRYAYRYASGRSGEWMRVGFAARARSLSVYLMDGCLGYGDDPEVSALLERLGPHKTGKACLYITRLDRVDEAVLRELIGRSWRAPAIGEEPAPDRGDG